MGQILVLVKCCSVIGQSRSPLTAAGFQLTHEQNISCNCFYQDIHVSTVLTGYHGNNLGQVDDVETC